MTGNDFPMISVMIATYNSGWILDKPLKALRAQSYPQDKLQIMIIDGGSTDNTFEIAEKYDCEIIDNPKTDPASAKRIGMARARGRYLLTVDHDEVLINPDSLRLRIDTLQNHEQCKIAFCSGYKCPKGYAGLNEYVSEFGDPFSLFYYRFSKGYKYYYDALCKNASLIEENSRYALFRFDKGWDHIIIEIHCMATIIDLAYFRTIYSEEKNPGDFDHLFYKMVEDGFMDTVMSKDDPLEHYSVDALSSYLPKLKWRIINNVHFQDQAKNGFTGRIEHMKGSQVKKMLFPFYSTSTVFPLLDGIIYSISRWNFSFMFHPFLCWYIILYILYQYIRRGLKLPPVKRAYNGDVL